MYEKVTYYSRISQTLHVPVPAVAAGYQGPGDVYGTAIAWWGLRAFTNAMIGQNAIQLVDSTGLNPSNIATVAGGGLDMTAVNQFISDHGQPFISIMYDQGSGSNTFDLAGTGTSRPRLNANVRGSFSGVVFSGAQGLESGNAACPTTQPYTCSWLGNINTASATQNLISSLSGNIQPAVYGTGPDRWATYAGGAASNSINITLTDFHAMQCLLLGGTTGGNSNAITYVDGTPASNAGVDIGNGVLNANDGFDVGSIILTSQLLIGTMMEGGLWSGDKSSLFSQMNSQQHTFYGF